MPEEEALALLRLLPTQERRNQWGRGCAVVSGPSWVGYFQAPKARPNKSRSEHDLFKGPTLSTGEHTYAE